MGINLISYERTINSIDSINCIALNIYIYIYASNKQINKQILLFVESVVPVALTSTRVGSVISTTHLSYEPPIPPLCSVSCILTNTYTVRNAKNTLCVQREEEKSKAAMHNNLVICKNTFRRCRVHNS